MRNYLEAGSDGGLAPGGFQGPGCGLLAAGAASGDGEPDWSDLEAVLGHGDPAKRGERLGGQIVDRTAHLAGQVAVGRGGQAT